MCPHANLFTDAYAALGSWGHQYNWEDGDESNNPWLSFVESDKIQVGQAKVIAVGMPGDCMERFRYRISWTGYW